MLITVNPSTEKVYILSIPRDTRKHTFRHWVMKLKYPTLTVKQE